MAEEKTPPHDAMHDVYWFAGIIIVLVILWYLAGGPSRADLGGILLHAPQPLDNGSAYGPNPQPQDTGYQNTSVPAPDSIGTTTGY